MTFSCFVVIHEAELHVTASLEELPFLPASLEAFEWKSTTLDILGSADAVNAQGSQGYHQDFGRTNQ